VPEDRGSTASIESVGIDSGERLTAAVKPEADRAALPLTIIEPTKGWAPLNIREVFRAHELLYFLVWRDVKVRYKQTAIGVAWAILQPLILMLLFTVLFSRVAKVPSEGLPYPLFSYSGLLPWTFFATGLTQSSRSLISNQSLLTKVYFPRIALPTAAVVAAAFDLAFASLVLAGLMLFYGVAPEPTVFLVPAFVVLGAVTALGVGTWLSAVNVKYRDVQYAIPFLLQLWLLATPIAYPASSLPHGFQIVVALNPMTSVVEGFRWAIFGTAGASPLVIATSFVISILVFVTGLFYFRRTERTFADVV
jgi:lipopolysaccharide transport system permease protein